MHWLIWYIKSCFCDHEFIYEEYEYRLFDSYDHSTIQEGPKVSITCKECGYHKSYWKF